MGKAKEFFLRMGRLWYMKYVVVLVLGLLYVGFLDENSFWAHRRNTQRIDDLTSEIASYKATYDKAQSQLDELEKDPKAVEKIARERYFMKAKDEDIFVLNEGSTPQPQTAGKE